MKNYSIAKRILSICLALIMCMSNVSPVLAEEYGIERYDDAGVERPGQQVTEAQTQTSPSGFVEEPAQTGSEDGGTPVTVQPEVSSSTSYGQYSYLSGGEAQVPVDGPSETMTATGTTPSGEELPVLPGN